MPDPLRASTLTREGGAPPERVEERTGTPRRAIPLARHAGWPAVSLPRRVVPYALTAAFLTVLYVRTLLPSVGYHMDTSKFGYLAQVLGTGHPPGEPLYLMLGAAWVRLLPAGNPAWRVNLLSAVFAVAACLVLMRVLRELGVGRWVAASGAALIGVSRLFWQQSIIAEVYSLNALFVAAVLWLLLAWLRTRRAALLVAALGLFEVSFANHPTGLLLLPGLVVFLARTGGHLVIRRRRTVLALAGCALLTVSTYAYIVWRSLDPHTPYVELDIHGWGSFWYAITAREFQGLMFGYGPLDFVTEQVPFALWRFWLQYSVFAAAGVWGFAMLWGKAGRKQSGQQRRHRDAAMLTGSWAVATGVFAMCYRVGDPEVFYFVSWMMLGLWIAVGLQDVIRRVPRIVARRHRLRWARLAPALVTGAAPLILANVHYTDVDLSDSSAAQQLSSAVAALPEDAIVFTPSFKEYQGLNYFLLPRGVGDRRHQYAELGAGPVKPDAERTHAGGVVDYCRGRDPMRLEWIRETVPPDLSVFIYGQDYARLVAGLGYPVEHASGKLYHMSCDRTDTPRP